MEIDLEVYRSNQRYLAFLLSEFLVSQLLRSLHAFDGDLIAPIVLGEIDQHNVRQFFRHGHFRPNSGEEQALEDLQERMRVLRPCNALSISAATGIPRETVRRRVEQLVEKGWIERHENGHLFASPALAAQFSHFNLETLRGLLAAAEEVRSVLAAAEDREAHPTNSRVGGGGSGRAR